MFFVLGVIARHFSAVVASRLFDRALFSEDVGAFQSAFFVVGLENETIPEIQDERAMGARTFALREVSFRIADYRPFIPPL